MLDPDPKPPAEPDRFSGKRSVPERSAKEQDVQLTHVKHSLEEGKATDIVVMELAGKTDIADYMVIATGSSSKHVVSLAEKLAYYAKHSSLGYLPPLEGAKTGDWVVVDLGNVIVHVFRREVREYYKLERMWGAPPSVDREEVLASV